MPLLSEGVKSCETLKQPWFTVHVRASNCGSLDVIFNILILFPRKQNHKSISQFRTNVDPFTQTLFCFEPIKTISFTSHLNSTLLQNPIITLSFSLVNTPQFLRCAVLHIQWVSKPGLVDLQPHGLRLIKLGKDMFYILNVSFKHP